MRVSANGMIEFDLSTPEAQENLHLIKKIRTKRSRMVEGKGANAPTWEHEWTEVELYDALAALLAMGKHYRLFMEKVEQDKSINIEGLEAILNKVYGSISK